MKRLILLIMLNAPWHLAHSKLTKESELIDKSTSSTKERKQEEKKFFNSFVIDTTLFPESGN